MCVSWLTAELRDLQTAYLALLAEIQAVLDTIPPSPPRATSPSLSPTPNSFFHFPRPHARARGRSNTSPAVPFHRSRRQITEEDGVGGGVGGGGDVDGDGRDVDRAWRWGDAMNSMVMLTSEESAARASAVVVVGMKGRGGRMRMGGLREMLKALRRSLPEQQQQRPAASASDASASTESSIGDGYPGQHYYEHPTENVVECRSTFAWGPHAPAPACLPLWTNENEALLLAWVIVLVGLCMLRLWEAGMLRSGGGGWF